MNKSANILIATLALATSGAFAADAEPAKPAPAATPAAKPADTDSPKTTMPTNTTPAPFESMDQGGQKYLLVSSIKTVEANKQFQQNVQLLQNQLAALKEFQKREQEALTIVEKEALKVKIIELNKSLEQNNAVMSKTYGFSLLRNYSVQIAKTRLLVAVSDAEYEAQKKKPEFKESDYVAGEKERFVRIATIDGVAANDIFRQNVQIMNAQRNRLQQIRQAIERNSAEKEKATLQEEFKKSEADLIKNNEDMFKTYGFSLARNYVMEIEEAKLFMAVTKEEFEKQQAESAKNAPATPAATAPAAAAKPAEPASK